MQVSEVITGVKMTRGGKRIGAGRPKQAPTVNYHRRIKLEWVKVLDEKLKELKEKDGE